MGYYCRPDLANLGQLWPLLRSDDRPQIHEVSEHLHTIVLPSNLKWPFGSDVGNVLFVRPSQQPILDRIMERFKQEGLLECHAGFDHPGFILKGTVGIGKTTFLNLLLYYAAQLNTDVVLHDAIKKTIFILRKDGTVDYHVVDGDLPMWVWDLLARPSTLYLFNPDGKGTQAFMSSAFTVIVTKPDENDYIRFENSFGMDRYFLAPWTLEEALDANRALPPRRRLEESTLRERFDSVGGSIHLLRSPENMYITTYTNITNFLASLTVKKLEHWYTMLLTEKSVGTFETHHYLFHCEPNEEQDRITRILRFAAVNTEALILRHIKIHSDDDWETLVDFLLEIDPDSCLDSRYENFVRAYMRTYKDFPSKLKVLKEKKLKGNSVLDRIRALR